MRTPSPLSLLHRTACSPLASIGAVAARFITTLLLVQPIFTGSAIASQKSAADYYVASLPGQPDGLLPKMHAGHIEVDPEHNGNLFFWHFASKHLADRPRTILWLNGGPGCSSLDGALMEIGPFRLNNDHTLRPLPSAWNDFANVLFVDQPFGTGFSYANTDSYDHEMGQLADHMVTFLEKWFAIFPQYRTDDLYIAGESYAGQHIPFIAQAIIDRNDRQSADSRWNLQGLLIGNGWISPREQYEAYVKFSKQRGILVSGTPAAKAVDAQMAECHSVLAEPGADDKIDIGKCESVLSTILDETEKDGQCYNMYDVRLQEPFPSCGSSWPPDLQYLTPYLRRNDVRKALHINPNKTTGWEECSSAVSKQLKNRHSKPAVQLLPAIIETGVPVLLFSGADDLICNHVGTEDLIANLHWNGATGFGNASRYDWVFDGENAGFYQSARNLTYVLTYNASHMVPYDRPAVSLDMLNRFLKVDVAGLLSSPVGAVLDTSTRNGSKPVSAPAAVESAKEKKAHERELEALRIQNEQHLRAAVSGAYKKSFFACATAFAFVICAVAFAACLRRKLCGSKGSSSWMSSKNGAGLGAYTHVTGDEEEEAISLIGVPKHAATDEHFEAEDFDESQLSVMHNVPELDPTSTKPAMLTRDD